MWRVQAIGANAGLQTKAFVHREPNKTHVDLRKPFIAAP